VETAVGPRGFAALRVRVRVRFAALRVPLRVLSDCIDACIAKPCIYKQ
jgi:hypothetical protein